MLEHACKRPQRALATSPHACSAEGADEVVELLLPPQAMAPNVENAKAARREFRRVMPRRSLGLAAMTRSAGPSESVRMADLRRR